MSCKEDLEQFVVQNFFSCVNTSLTYSNIAYLTKRHRYVLWE